MIAGKNMVDLTAHFAVTGSQDAIYVGGITDDLALIDGGGFTDTRGAPILSRIDLSTTIINWSMVYTGMADFRLEMISGLTLSPDSSKLAIIAFN